jgi:soluble lytic murein transglycosylase-like protein
MRRKHRERRSRNRRRLGTMLAAGTALFVPHAGKFTTPPVRKPAPQTLARAERALVPEVTTSATFRLTDENAYEDLIHQAAAKFSLNPDLIRAVIRTESAFDALAVSSAGAQGLMQLMPALAVELGVTDAFDPEQNIMAGSRYLSALLIYHGGDIPLALASYNAGPGAVARYHGIPPYRETERYVKTIVDLLEDSEP